MQEEKEKKSRPGTYFCFRQEEEQAVSGLNPQSWEAFYKTKTKERLKIFISGNVRLRWVEQ